MRNRIRWLQASGVCFVLGLVLPLWPITLPLCWFLAFGSLCGAATNCSWPIADVPDAVFTNKFQSPKIFKMRKA